MGHFLQITIARKTLQFLKKNYTISRERELQKWATFCKSRSQEKLCSFSRKLYSFPWSQFPEINRPYRFRQPWEMMIWYRTVTRLIIESKLRFQPQFAVDIIINITDVSQTCKPYFEYWIVHFGYAFWSFLKLKGCNNVNCCLKLKHDLSSQIPDLRYNFCQVNGLFETLSTSNVNIENVSIESKGLIMKYTIYTRKSPLVDPRECPSHATFNWPIKSISFPRFAVHRTWTRSRFSFKTVLLSTTIQLNT